MQQFTVIGAGLVGVCCALHLQREGFTVRLVDKGEPGMKASFGNSGSFGTASCVPFALPGVLKKVPKMLLDPTSPLKLRWGHVPEGAALLPAPRRGVTAVAGRGDRPGAQLAAGAYACRAMRR